MVKLDHPNIVKILEYYDNRDKKRSERIGFVNKDDLKKNKILEKSKLEFSGKGESQPSFRKAIKILQEIKYLKIDEHRC